MAGWPGCRELRRLRDGKGGKRRPALEEEAGRAKEVAWEGKVTRPELMAACLGQHTAGQACRGCGAAAVRCSSLVPGRRVGGREAKRKGGPGFMRVPH